MNTRFTLLASAAFAFAVFGGCSKDEDKGAKNPCGSNPCGKKAKNPCGAKGAKNVCNPCGGAKAKIDAKEVTQPKGFEPNAHGLDDKALLAKGEELFKDTKLSAHGASCNTCHASPGMYKESFASAYPHQVAMAVERSGMDQVTAAEMVQFCMKAPMKADVFAWDSVELAALTRVVEERNKDYRAMPADARNKMQSGKNACNPCGGKKAKNPCNPCGGNPCGN